MKPGLSSNVIEVYDSSANPKTVTGADALARCPAGAAVSLNGKTLTIDGGTWSEDWTTFYTHQTINYGNTLNVKNATFNSGGNLTLYGEKNSSTNKVQNNAVVITDSTFNGAVTIYGASFPFEYDSARNTVTIAGKETGTKFVGSANIYAATGGGKNTEATGNVVNLYGKTAMAKR